MNYRLPSVEKIINGIIGFIFYYRLVFVLLATGLIIYFGIHTYNVTKLDDRLKNASLVFTCGAIIIGIFYSIINYEHNQLKFRHDVKTLRETLTFTTSCKMHEVQMIKHFRTIKSFYTENKTLFVQNNCVEIANNLKEKPETRESLIVVFNYFEGIALGVMQGIMDEPFVKEFFQNSIYRAFNKLWRVYRSFKK